MRRGLMVVASGCLGVQAGCTGASGIPVHERSGDAELVVFGVQQDHVSEHLPRALFRTSVAPSATELGVLWLESVVPGGPRPTGLPRPRGCRCGAGSSTTSLRDAKPSDRGALARGIDNGRAFGIVVPRFRNVAKGRVRPEGRQAVGGRSRHSPRSNESPLRNHKSCSGQFTSGTGSGTGTHRRLHGEAARALRLRWFPVPLNDEARSSLKSAREAVSFSAVRHRGPARRDRVLDVIVAGDVTVSADHLEELLRRRRRDRFR